MKKLINLLLVAFTFVISAFCQMQWADLQPMQEVSHEDYISLFTDNYEQLKGAVYEMSYKKVTVCFLDEEPDYKVPKVKNAGPRMLICLELNSAEDEMFFKALCVDSYSKKPETIIRTNKFGFCMQAYDSKGKNLLIYTGILVDDIASYPLGNIVIGTGAYENSFDCIIKEAPFYFWDKSSKKVMCFNSNGAVLTKTNIRVENPMFAFSSESRGKEFRELYLMDLNPKTKEPLPGKVWFCSNANFTPVKTDE